MVRADVFRQVLWRFLLVRLPACAEPACRMDRASAGRRRIFGFSRGAFLVRDSSRDEMRSD
ncbi:MAG: hypothetical protein G01um101466_808 [Parcubacteria group bacterium Gr01-1014_66]|nr:MAG: hypothetical protein G01um101466_808 [Parcubacteria group bacterium Gr01-1014_66]